MSKPQHKQTTAQATAQLHVFPFFQRRSLVHELAAALAGLPYIEGKTFWQTRCKGFRSELRAAGFSTPEIRQQIADLSNAVTSGMRQVSHLNAPASQPSAEIIPIQERRANKRPTILPSQPARQGDLFSGFPEVTQ